MKVLGRDGKRLEMWRFWLGLGATVPAAAASDERSGMPSSLSRIEVVDKGKGKEVDDDASDLDVTRQPEHLTVPLVAPSVKSERVHLDLDAIVNVLNAHVSHLSSLCVFTVVMTSWL